MVDLERQVTEKDDIISFLSKQIINKNRYGDSWDNTTVNDHNGSFHQGVEIINNNFPLGPDNKKNKRENIIIVGDLMLKNINSHGISRTHPSMTIQVPPMKIFLVQ